MPEAFLPDIKNFVKYEDDPLILDFQAKAKKVLGEWLNQYLYWETDFQR